ncbi:hypothetical protein DD238_004944 [Peronospora effusa]|uniref:FYVE-type domain-containing protein n=1 Tax=Peronospora effusa TaxID=542832 RepID=A0A3M6VBL0_9STRA|nr:hypothetical protein DD238_004944 [Peronospora effusa]
MTPFTSTALPSEANRLRGSLTRLGSRDSISFATQKQKGKGPMPLTATSFLLQTTAWISLDVRRGSVADISISIPSIAAQDENDLQECLVWQFLLQEYDIGFELLENGAVVQYLGRFKAAERPTSGFSTNDTTPPLSLQFDALEPTAEGKFNDIKPETVYTLRWDNLYSLVRHKQVQYRFLVASRRVVAVAELAVQESQSRLQKRARRTAAGLPLPHLAKTLLKERLMTDDDIEVEKKRMMATLEQTVMDIVAIFTAKPDNPLHEGAVRPFVLVLEAILCNGIKEEFLDVWPEAPYYEFLLETQYVLRDDLGIVAEIQARVPPSNLKYLGWNRSRSFLLLALNKGILQRAFENLSKRRTVVEKYYEPRALMYKYDDARKIASFISALNGVTFLLAAYPPDECNSKDQHDFPRNLKQCAPAAPLFGNEIAFQDGLEGDSAVVKLIEGDPDEIKHLEDCTVPRHILHEESFQDIVLLPRCFSLQNVLWLRCTAPKPRRASFELHSLSGSGAIFLAQLRVQTQDILLTLTTHAGQDLTRPLQLSASDELVEVSVRFKSDPVGGLAVKLDNSFSMVRSKQVHIRCISADKRAYKTAWEGCLNMARSISWNHASRDGNERCDKFMASLHEKEETEVTLQRQQDGCDTEDGHQDKEEGSMGFRSSLLSKPVSYIVGGLLSNEGSVEACDQCLTPFSFFSRQHECPCCKKIVCIQCSRHYVKRNDKVPQLKVCDGCFVKEKEKERTRIARMKCKVTGNGREQPEYAALRRDPAVDKYFKMLSFGVPRSAVTQKMTQDEMPSEQVAIFAAGPDGSDVSHVGRAERRKQCSDSRCYDRRDSTFRKIYWTSLEKANETIWTRMTARRKTAPITLSSQDFRELEHRFGNRTAVLPSGSKENTAAKVKFSSLDSRRANNILIGLSQFKAFGGADSILSALKRCDFEYLSVDRLTKLLVIAPNSMEAKRYSNFKGSRSHLEPSEKFLVEMCEISRVTEKINVMLFAAQFEHQQQELNNRIRVIIQACYEVLHCERLARCFELVLAIGNILNTGTELEGAQGITLASLLKLSETKAIDRSMTLLQFIIKLIHDRGEGDVLLFVNDLSTLCEARRFSNVMCDSQARALQHDISKLEQEIKEDMIEDLKRFNKAEAVRKLRFDQPTHPGHRSSSISERAGMIKRNEVAKHSARGRSSESRNSILNAIRQRNTTSMADAPGQINTVGTTLNSQRTDLLAAVRSRHREEVDSDVTERASQTSIFSAIRSKRSVDQSADASAQSQPRGLHEDSPVQDTFHAAALTCIPNKSRRTPAENNKAQGRQVRSEVHQASGLAASKQYEVPTSSPDNRVNPVHSALLESIQQHRTRVFTDDTSGVEQNGSSTLNGHAQAALLAAIRQRSSKPNRDMLKDGVNDSSIDDEDLEPRQYQMKSKFISVMRERLLIIKTAFEDIEMNLDTLHSVWDGTARYLAEDSSASSSEYVFGLLNRFLLDVKVAKTLLFRKGLSFANEASIFVPDACTYHILCFPRYVLCFPRLSYSENLLAVQNPLLRMCADVGSTIATRFGAGVITALRVVDKRIEVKFPWSKEAYLTPSAILSVGSLVQCRQLGVGIIRKTCYDMGFCDVRFSFGYGKVRVEDLTLETRSNQQDLRCSILRSGFIIGDPVITSFGCGHVQWIRRDLQNPESVLSVSLLASDSDVYGRDYTCTAVAFVSARNVKWNY